MTATTPNLSQRRYDCAECREPYRIDLDTKRPVPHKANGQPCPGSEQPYHDCRTTPEARADYQARSDAAWAQFTGVLDATRLTLPTRKARSLR